MQPMLGNTLNVDLLSVLPDTMVINRKEQNPSFSSLLNGVTDEILHEDSGNKEGVDETNNNSTGPLAILDKKGITPNPQESENTLLEAVALPVIDVGEGVRERFEVESYQPSTSFNKEKGTQKKAAGSESFSKSMMGLASPKETTPPFLSSTPQVNYPDKAVDSDNPVEVARTITNQSDSILFSVSRDLPEKTQLDGIKIADHLGFADQSRLIKTKDEKLSTSEIKESTTLNGKTPSSNPIPEQHQSGKAHLKADKDSHGYKAVMLDRTINKGTIDDPSSSVNRTAVATQADKNTPSELKDNPHPAIVNSKATTVQDHAAKDQSSSYDLMDNIDFADHVVLKNHPDGEAANFYHKEQKNRNVVPDSLQPTIKGHTLASRSEAIHIRPLMENKNFELNDPIEINTQSVIDKIIDAKQLMNNTSGRVKIILDPPNLGPVNLDIIVRKEWVDVVMTTDNMGVQQALQSRVDEIRVALQRQDFKVENFQVLLHHNTTNHQLNYGGNTSGNTGKQYEEQKHGAEDITVKPLLGQTIGQAGRTQGLISLFV